MKRIPLIMLAACACLLGSIRTAPAADSETSRQTLAGLRGVYVLVEDLQPNIVKLSDRFNFSRDQLRDNVASKLRKAGIKVLSREEWLTCPGRPILYVAMNTDQREKYWWAYDIRLELQQMSSLEANPATRALVSTWSTNMTGVVNLGTLGILSEQTSVLTDVFINAFAFANVAPGPKPAR